MNTPEVVSVNDIRVNRAFEEFKVLAIHGDYAWCKWDDRDAPQVQTLSWVREYTTPIPDFFEEGCQYVHRLSLNAYIVQAVVETSDGLIAVVKYGNRDGHYAFGEDRWKTGNYRKI